MNPNSKEDLKAFKGKNTKIAGFGMRMQSSLGVTHFYVGGMGPFLCQISSYEEGEIRVLVNACSNNGWPIVGDKTFKVNEFELADKFVENSVKGFMDKAVSQST